MGALTESIHAEIEERRARHPGRPDRELLEHLLVGLERERVVAVGFDGARLAERLATTALGEGVRRVITRVVAQVWLDENMHARYLTGLLHRQPRLALHLEALAQSLQGGLAGWVVSVQQLSRFQDAPVDRSMAAVVELAGRLAGKIPAEVGEQLSHKSLAEYCRFNADAEESAAVSFARMLQLAPEVEAQRAASSEPDTELALALPPGFAAEVARMEADERLHAHAFEAIASLLGPDDQLLPGKTEAELVAALAAIDGWLVPTGLLAEGSRVTPGERRLAVGAGGPVAVTRGERLDDKLACFQRALELADFVDYVEAAARESGKPREQVVVAIKPDFMMAYRTSDPSTFTETALVEELVRALRALGFRDIRVCEAQNLYSRYYENRDVASVARYLGYAEEGYRIHDLSLELEQHAFTRGMGVYAIGRSWRDADVRITFAKLKTHVNATCHLTLRTTTMVVPQLGDYLFGDRLTDLTSVGMAVLHDFPPHFALVDGYEHAADGLMGFMADPTPKHPQLFIAGPDVICVDYIGMILMGERDPTRALDLRAAIDWFGDPRERGWVLGDMTPIADWDRADSGLLSGPLVALAGPVYQAVSGQGAYFTADMDPEAFPAKDESGGLAALRGALRTVLGYRAKKA
jgi:uncharacterized protein (DUF362 family)